MKKHLARPTHIIDVLLPLVLFFTFALGALCLVLFAARVYSEAARLNSTSSCRTAISYVTEKVRAGDEGGDIEIGMLDSCPALMIHETSGEDELVTCIYVKDGELLELLATEEAAAGGTLTDAAGSPVLSLTEMTFSEPMPGLLKISCTDANGSSESALIALRSGQE